MQLSAKAPLEKSPHKIIKISRYVYQIRSHLSDEFPPHRLSKQQMIRTITKVISQMTTSFLSIDFIVFPLFLQLYIKPYYLLHLVKTRNLN